MAPPPIVTGVSPKEGPPGTRITIRGENLGVQPNDVVSILICGSDCVLSAEWKSPNKIIARSGPGKGRGDIIVVTNSGGVGSCTVQFRGYHETVGPLKESAVWVDESTHQSLPWGHRSISLSTFHLDDPLGLSVEESEKIPEDDLHEMFSDASGELTCEQFEPKWFLLENHHATSFDDLKVGLSYLKRKVQGQKEGQLSFLKDNVSSVMEQMDTLFLLKEKFEEYEKLQKGEDPTSKIQNAVKQSISEANKLFEDVLARREKAECVRNALALMTRYKLLFNLPSVIEGYIRNGDYDLVISDCARIKNLYGKSDVAVFQQVLKEVDNKLNNLKVILLNKLNEKQTTLEMRKKIIRYLTLLGVSDDVGWELISNTCKHIDEYIRDCESTYVDFEREIQNVDAGTKGLRSANRIANKLPTSGGMDMNNIPNRVMFLEELCEILLQSMPQLWKLAQAYFNGELHVKPIDGNMAEFRKKVLSIVEAACIAIRVAILPDIIIANSHQRWPNCKNGRATVANYWLPHCVRNIRSLYRALISLELPSDALDCVAKLLFDFGLHSMKTQLKSTADLVGELKTKETWVYEYLSGKGTITRLPRDFESLILEMLQRMKESALHRERREAAIFENASAKQEWKSLLGVIFSAFVNCLEELGMLSEDQDHSLAVSQLIGSPMPFANYDSNTPSWEQRLLSTLSNCQYTREYVIANLVSSLAQDECPSIEDVVAKSVQDISQLESRLLETYVEKKTDPLIGTIEPSMYLGHFNWDSNTVPTDARPYVKEILVNVTAVFAEVRRCIPKLLKEILSRVVEMVAEELYRLMSCVTKFSEAGNQQARIDILCVRNTFRNFLSNDAEMYLADALKALPILETDASNILVNNLVKSFERKMKLQILCFSEGELD